jgi:hypothetical protein
VTFKDNAAMNYITVKLKNVYSRHIWRAYYDNNSIQFNLIQFFIFVCCINSRMASYRYSTEEHKY